MVDKPWWTEIVATSFGAVIGGLISSFSRSSSERQLRQSIRYRFWTDIVDLSGKPITHEGFAQTLESIWTLVKMNPFLRHEVFPVQSDFAKQFNYDYLNHKFILQARSGGLTDEEVDKFRERVSTLMELTPRRDRWWKRLK